MKRPSVLLLVLLPALAQAEGSRSPETTDTTRVERGRYLVETGACHDCHTPHRMGKAGPEPDMGRQLSGHPAGQVMPSPPAASGPWVWGGAGVMTAFHGPWGVSYAMNLTPDKETGIGSWREEDFVRALKTGRHMGAGRPILPPMPWSWYARFTETDLRAIYRYLQTLPPVKNRVPEPQPPAPAAAPSPSLPPSGSPAPR
jgi:mono/diheme cytochrome c family protein